MSKKKVFALALAVCLIAIASMSTLAWFNATDSVENQFKFDDTDGDGTPDFKVDIFETDSNGNPRPAGKEYPHVAPGAVLAKDPTVKNIGDYGMYTRIVVTLSNASVWIAASDKYSIADDDNCILEEMVDIHPNWVRFDNPVYDAAANTLTYVYYHNGIVEKGVTTAPLFTTVTIPTEPQQEDLRFADNKFTITVKADAVQSDNIIAPGATITGNEAYTAFVNANWTAGQAYPEPVTNP